VVSVKGGEHVGVGMVRDLHSVMARERAPIGVLLSRSPPSAPMLREAAAVGRFHSEAMGRSYARLQILTIDELFGGKRPDIPLIDPVSFRPTAREGGSGQAQLL
jgi:site-specific DNA-methyltransferase (adenine-specific)